MDAQRQPPECTSGCPCCEERERLRIVLRRAIDRLDLSTDLEPGQALDAVVVLMLDLEDELAA